MINYSAICNDFLCQYGMHPDFFDIEEQTAVFLNEMEKGLCGRNSSLLMLPTYISVDKPVPREDSVIVIDAGGTNLRIALVSPNQDRALQIFQYEKYPMPGTNGTISFEQMCDQIAMYLFPLLVHTSNIAIEEITLAAYFTSVALAEKRGSFPGLDTEKFLESGFIQKHIKENNNSTRHRWILLCENIRRCGIRNAKLKEK